MADLSRVDKIIQYVLQVAGDQDDFRDQQLGPTHFIKYVYLADLAYARSHDGTTYSDVNWIFHSFGPWSAEVFERIEPALNEVQAEKITFQSDYGKDDWHRWKFSKDNYLQKDLGVELPIAVCGDVRKHVRQFGAQTPELLHFVYATKPMRNTAPGEVINFQIAARIRHEGKQNIVESKGQTKKVIKKLEALKARLDSGEFDQNGFSEPNFKPVYGDVFANGMNWLDKLAGPSIEASEHNVEFDPGIWKSGMRTDDGLS